MAARINRSGKIYEKLAKARAFIEANSDVFVKGGEISFDALHTGMGTRFIQRTAGDTVDRIVAKANTNATYAANVQADFNDVLAFHGLFMSKRKNKYIIKDFDSTVEAVEKYERNTDRLEVIKNTLSAGLMTSRGNYRHVGDARLKRVASGELGRERNTKYYRVD